ncbi:MAG: MG284/MPN403 family protein [Erysipelotrichaceae bacterium]
MTAGFREISQIVKNIFDKYNKSRFMLENYNQQDKNYDLYLLVQFALDDIDEDSKRILTQEYINKRESYWWNDYYSQTTYYSLKRKRWNNFWLA